MNTKSIISTADHGASECSKDFTTKETEGSFSAGCKIDIEIDCRGDVNIYNCTTSPGTATIPTPTLPPCSPLYGACIPVVPGAKHKLAREDKLKKLIEGILVPSSLAAGLVHVARRFVLGKTPANPHEVRMFATLKLMSRDILACTVAAFDAIPAGQRDRLFAQSLILDPDQPIDEGILTAALAQEIKQRVGLLVFDDTHGLDEERPGRMRVYEPHGEDFFSQVRICSVNDLRTANFLPRPNIGDYLPTEIQQDCEAKIVDGQAQVVCQIRTADCPGNPLDNVCARVPDVALGDGVVLQGVNYFSIDTKVRFIDKQTGATVRDVETNVWGDTETPVTEEVNGSTMLINDCRVHDRLTFRVPDDLAPAVYVIQVVVPNITGIAFFGAELISNTEYINVIPPSTARFQIVTETIIARKETWPDWLPGSDEVGLHTMAIPIDLNFQPSGDLQEQKFTDIQEVDFDSGTRRDITRKVFEHDVPILGLVLVILGDEIDSRRLYHREIRTQTDYFLDLIKKEAAFVGGALTAAGGAKYLLGLSGIYLVVTGIAALILLGIDIIMTLWAPADPIIRDSIGLSVTDLATLTSANAPAPLPVTFTTENGIVVNVNKLVPPVKLPLEYHETREYVSDDQDSRYEITYRYNRLA